MINDHITISRDLLRKFVAGELDETENDRVMTRLAEDDSSLEMMDALWDEQTLYAPDAALPHLDPEQAKRIRRRLLHHIHRANLTKNVLRLGTQGFGSVAMSLIRPLLSTKNQSRRNKRRRKSND